MSEDVNIDRLSALVRVGIACPHCGNEVLRRGERPMRFPRPDCVSDVDAVRKAIEAAKGETP